MLTIYFIVLFILIFNAAAALVVSAARTWGPHRQMQTAESAGSAAAVGVMVRAAESAGYVAAVGEQ